MFYDWLFYYNYPKKIKDKKKSKKKLQEIHRLKDKFLKTQRRIRKEFENQKYYVIYLQHVHIHQINKFPFTVAIIYGVLLGERPAKKRVFPGALLYPQEL